MLLDGREINLDTEQEREQEQEQQKEVQAKKDQQIEVEKFVDREYSRTKEAPSHWPVSVLGDPKTNARSTAQESDALHPFYDLSTFHLRHQNSMEFPEYVMASTNYFNRSWTGLRRLKNVVMLLEWVPSVANVRQKLLNPTEIEALRKVVNVSEEEVEVLRKAFTLLSFEGRVHLTAADLRNAIEMASFSSVSNTQLDEILKTFGSRTGGSACVEFDAFQSLLQSGRVFEQQEGRFWVAVNLAEAETLRRLIHVKQSSKKPLVEGSDSAIALRYSPAAPIVDTSNPSKKQQTQAIHNKRLDSFCGIVFDSSDRWKDLFGQEVGALCPSVSAQDKGPCFLHTNGHSTCVTFTHTLTGIHGGEGLRRFSQCW